MYSHTATNINSFVYKKYYMTINHIYIIISIIVILCFPLYSFVKIEYMIYNFKQCSIDEPWLYITDRLRRLSMNWGIYRYVGI